MRYQWCLLHRHIRLCYYYFLSPQNLTSPLPIIPSLRHYSSSSSNVSDCNLNSSLSTLGWYFASSDAQRLTARQQLCGKVSILRENLLKVKDDSIRVYEVLQQMGLPLFSSYYDGSAMVLLLSQLHDFPLLSLEVFNWRRKYAGLRRPITREEYAKGIRVSGRAKNIELAVELFNEAINNDIKTPSIYNSLMGVYLVNGMPDKVQSLFREFKRDECYRPTVVTYNILISVFARLMLVDHMEATLQEMYDEGFSPNSYTFNSLIAGYITAWMWDRMESTYKMMKTMKIKPDKNTYMLMLRGYAHSGNLERMEEIYERGKHHFGKDDMYLIRLMICAYCKNSCANRLEKIDSLVGLIPEHEFKPWLNVMLIRVYAKEHAVERMEDLIDIAFEQNTIVHTMNVMIAIITVYYRLNAVEKLTSFVKRAESAGWRICRSLYHCKMVMYSTQSRLEEMENVLVEMEKSHICQTKKTWAILYKAYSNLGPRCKLEQVIGVMCKLGYGLPS